MITHKFQTQNTFLITLQTWILETCMFYFISSLKFLAHAHWDKTKKKKKTLNTNLTKHKQNNNKVNKKLNRDIARFFHNAPKALVDTFDCWIIGFLNRYPPLWGPWYASIINKLNPKLNHEALPWFTHGSTMVKLHDGW